LTVAGDCRGIGNPKVIGEAVRLAAQLEQAPEGDWDVRVPEEPR